jgi:hypothetical protein
MHAKEQSNSSNVEIVRISEKKVLISWFLVWFSCPVFAGR